MLYVFDNQANILIHTFDQTEEAVIRISITGR